MVPPKERLEEKGTVSQQRLLGAQSPVKGYLQVVGAFRERPDAPSDEITGRFDGESMGSAGLNDPRIPPKPVGQLATRQESIALANLILFVGRQRRCREINIGPPAKIAGDIRQNLIDIFRTAFDPPVSQKNVVVRWHSAGSS